MKFYFSLVIEQIIAAGLHHGIRGALVPEGVGRAVVVDKNSRIDLVVAVKFNSPPIHKRTSRTGRGGHTLRIFRAGQGVVEVIGSIPVMAIGRVKQGIAVGYLIVLANMLKEKTS